MTVIVYRDGIMAADGSSWLDDVCTSLTERKIKRAPDGSLYACTGLRSDIEAFYGWVDAGRYDGRPKPKDTFGCLFVESDGRIMKYINEAPPYESTTPWALDGASREFMAALMLGGFSAESTVRMAIKHTPWAAGDVQVESLNR